MNRVTFDCLLAVTLAGAVLKSTLRRGGTQPRYQLFGASMDVVQAMEQSSLPGRVHMSAAFVAAIEDGGEEFLVCDRQPDGSAFLDVPVGDELVDV
jgi:hypothetical protein